MSWRDFPEALRLDYEDLSENPLAAMSKVLAFSGVNFSDSDLTHALSMGHGSKIRFNAGVSGRGAAVSPADRDTVRSLVEIYAKRFDDSYLRQHLA